MPCKKPHRGGKGLFGLQFQITVRHLEEDKARTQVTSQPQSRAERKKCSLAYMPAVPSSVSPLMCSPGPGERHCPQWAGSSRIN